MQQYSNHILDLMKIIEIPLRPVELNIHKSNNGAPSKSSAKPRNPVKFLKLQQANKKKETKRIRKIIVM